jgi:hypothetical protein
MKLHRFGWKSSEAQTGSLQPLASSIVQLNRPGTVKERLIHRTEAAVFDKSSAKLTELSALPGAAISDVVQPAFQGRQKANRRLKLV